MSHRVAEEINTQLNNKRILVVDDEKDIRDLLCMSLERMGFMAFPAATFADAKELILALN